MESFQVKTPVVMTSPDRSEDGVGLCCSEHGLPGSSVARKLVRETKPPAPESEPALSHSASLSP